MLGATAQASSPPTPTAIRRRCWLARMAQAAPEALRSLRPPPTTPAYPSPRRPPPTVLRQSVPDPYGDVDFNLVHTDKLVLDIGGMGQVLGLGQIVDDPYHGPRSRLSLHAARRG